MNAAAIPAHVPAETNAAALAELNELVARARAVQVTNADEYATAVAICQRIAGSKKRREEERLTITRKMDEAKQTVLNFFRSTFFEPLETVDGIVRKKLKDYDAEQRRIADARRKEAEAEAERARQAAAARAREEQAKAAQKAQAERAEAERKRKEAEDARKKEAEARAAGDAQAAKAAAATAAKAETAAIRAENKAEATTAAGQARVEDLNAQAASIVAPVILPDTPKVKGQARRVVWKYRVVDASKIDRRFLMPDDQKITRQVQALHKEAADLVGGIEVWSEDDISIRGARS